MYAARHPERVSHLILWCTFARGSDYFESSHSQALHAMAHTDWPLFLQTIAHAELGWSAGDVASQLAAQLREHVAPTAHAAHDAMARAADVTALLPRVRAATLVVHRRHVSHPHEHVPRELASGIAHARLAVLDGESVAPFVGDSAAGLALIEEFLTERTVAETRVPVNSHNKELVDPPSSRELEVLTLLAAGKSNDEIARSLFVTVGAVKTHVHALYRKLDVHSRTQAVARARELHLIVS